MKKGERFNRTILECKAASGIMPSVGMCGVNRTILECKAAELENTLVAFSDLIEPYWNVKMRGGFRI